MIERLVATEHAAIAAHRGYKSRYPENTLLAFREALDLGVDMLEFDLRGSKDGRVVVIHDETVDRTTNGTGPVGDFTLSELKRLDAGGWFGPAFRGLEIPTLEELCALLAGYPDAMLNVEIKRDRQAMDTASRAVETLRKAGLIERCVFTSFDAGILAYLHDTHGLKTQGFPSRLMTGFVEGERGTYGKMWAVGLEMALLTPDIVREFEDRGILPWCYCPDDAEQVGYALECGAKLLTCNDPLPALAARGEGGR